MPPAAKEDEQKKEEVESSGDGSFMAKLLAMHKAMQTNDSPSGGADEPRKEPLPQDTPEPTPANSSTSKRPREEVSRESVEAKEAKQKNKRSKQYTEWAGKEDDEVKKP